jgi:hypothetical protein
VRDCSGTISYTIVKVTLEIHIKIENTKNTEKNGPPQRPTLLMFVPVHVQCSEPDRAREQLRSNILAARDWLHDGLSKTFKNL